MAISTRVRDATGLFLDLIRQIARRDYALIDVMIVGEKMIIGAPSSYGPQLNILQILYCALFEFAEGKPFPNVNVFNIRIGFAIGAVCWLPPQYVYFINGCPSCPLGEVGD